MNDKNIKPGTLVGGMQGSLDAEMRHLLARMDDMQMEIGILKETINVLKKTSASTQKPSKTVRRQRLLMP